MTDLADVLGETPKKAKKEKAAAPAKANGKATPAKTAKAAAAPAVAKKTTAPAPKAKEKEKPAPAKVKVADDVSTTAPEDKVVLAAVRKLKEPTLAATLASGLGVHRRVIRAQLQRLAKDKANGIKMAKDGFNWVVSHKS